MSSLPRTFSLKVFYRKKPILTSFKCNMSKKNILLLYTVHMTAGFNSWEFSKLCILAIINNTSILDIVRYKSMLLLSILP